MRRMMIQIDDDTYASLRKRSFEEKRSMASIVRECLSGSGTPRPLSIRDFSFVGSCKSKQGKLAPVSERHDEALAEVLAPKKRRR